MKNAILQETLTRTRSVESFWVELPRSLAAGQLVQRYGDHKS